MKKKRIRLMILMSFLVLAMGAGGILLLQNRNNEAYQSLSESDKETADLYATLYEMSQEEVAQIQKETNDWEKTAKELEIRFFTIPENVKYQMIKEGYSLDDLEEAEELSVKTGTKAIELAKARGKQKGE